MTIKKCVRCKIPKSFEDDFYFIGKSKTMVYGICKECIDDDIHQQTENQQIVANNLKLENMSKDKFSTENVNIKCTCCGIEKGIYAFAYMVNEKKFLDKCDECIGQSPKHHELNQSNHNHRLRQPLSDRVLSPDALDAFGLKYLNWMLTTKDKLRLNSNHLDSTVSDRCEYLLNAGYSFDASTITVKTPPNKINKNGKVIDGLYNGKKGITFRMTDKKGKVKQVGVNLTDFIYYINLKQFNSLKSVNMENSNKAAQGANVDAVASNVQSVVLTAQNATTVAEIEQLLNSKFNEQMKLDEQLAKLKVDIYQLTQQLIQEKSTPEITHSSFVDFATANDIPFSDATTPIIEMQLKSVTLPNDLQEENGVTLYPIAVLKKTFNIK